MATHINDLWGKTNISNPSEYHPLIYHLIDSIVVTREIWNNVLVDSVKDLMSSSLNIANEEAVCWISFFSGLHDIGKACPGFQRKSLEQYERLSKLGYEFPDITNQDDHRLMTAFFVKEAFEGKYGLPRLDRNTKNTIFHALGGHHGSFVNPEAIINIVGSDVGTGNWEISRRNIILSLSRITRINEISVPRVRTADKSRFFLLLTGLVTISDWISSCSIFFPYTSDIIDIDKYYIQSKSKAKSVIKSLDWIQDNNIGKRSFKEVFPSIAHPYPLQTTIEEKADILEKSGLTILEAPMGEGKTEAAFYLMERINRLQKKERAFIGLPTQTTSNQMFERLSRYLEERSDLEDKINLVLIHGHAVLSSEYQQLIVNYSNGDDAESNLIANEWFTFKKRALLSPFGVGTIDQALLSILPIKHFYVRLFGLAGKTIIIDEVHAYDLYMSTLLDRLLSWLSALKSNVILLSATLPRQRRNQLIKAYTGQDIFCTDVKYPRITWESKGLITAHTFDSASKTDKSRPSIINIRFMEDSIDEIIKLLNKSLTDGGRIAIICNTVKKAQDIYRTLISNLDKDIEIGLLHSRFLSKDRHSREKAYLKAFGKEDKTSNKRILISTQIIEQSLDLDFDLMISEMAPVDLLIQRIGRLHRHGERKRPSPLSEPNIVILNPELDEKRIPDFGSSRLVYSEYILLKSYFALRDKDEILIPDDIENLVELVYGENEIELPSPIDEALIKAKNIWKGGMEKARKEAECRLLYGPNYDRPWEMKSFLLSEDEKADKKLRALTRLTMPSVSLICLFETNNCYSTDRNGEYVIDLSKTPSKAEVNLLLNNAFNIANYKIVEYFCNEGVTPPMWKKNALLNKYKLAIFQRDDFDNYFCNSGEIHISLDEELGLVIGGNMFECQ